MANTRTTRKTTTRTTVGRGKSKKPAAKKIPAELVNELVNAFIEAGGTVVENDNSSMYLTIKENCITLERSQFDQWVADNLGKMHEAYELGTQEDWINSTFPESINKGVELQSEKPTEPQLELVKVEKEPEAEPNAQMEEKQEGASDVSLQELMSKSMITHFTSDRADTKDSELCQQTQLKAIKRVELCQIFELDESKDDNYLAKALAKRGISLEVNRETSGLATYRAYLGI